MADQKDDQSAASATDVVDNSGKKIEKVTASTTNSGEKKESGKLELAGNEILPPPTNTDPPVIAKDTDTEPPPVSKENEVPGDAVVVDEKDVAEAETDTAALSNQIESLTGEIQSLQSKIERLSGSATTSQNADKPTGEETPKEELPKPETTPEASDAAKEGQGEEKKPEEPAKKEEPPAPPPPPAEPEKKEEVKKEASPPPAKSSSNGSGTINDIYAKIQNDQSAMSSEPTTSQTEPSGSNIAGTSGEILVVFGSILLVILLGSPLFITNFSTNVQEVIKVIGWPTASICLLIGWILSLFNHGKIFVKIFIFLLVVIAVVLTLAVFGRTSILGPLAPLLQSVLSFYQK